MKLFEKILDVIFIICTIAFFISTVVLVIGQAIAIITLNGEMSITISEIIVEPAGIVAAISTIVAIILGYLRGQMKSST